MTAQIRVGVLLLGAVLLLLAVLGLIAGIGGAIGDEIGGQHAGHVGAGGVVLTQEARQQAGAETVFNSPRGLLWQALQGLREKLGWGLAASRFVACAGREANQNSTAGLVCSLLHHLH